VAGPCWIFTSFPKQRLRATEAFSDYQNRPSYGNDDLADLRVGFQKLVGIHYLIQRKSPGDFGPETAMLQSTPSPTASTFPAAL
jgi:hypothetical protein